MTNVSYIFILVWTAFVALLANATKGKRTENLCGKNVIRYKKIWALVIAVPIIYLTANRGDIGDTLAYVRAFSSMPNSASEFLDYMQTVSKDELFYFVSAFIHIFITKSSVVYLAIIAAFQFFVLVKIYRKYSEDFFISIFLFFASTDYISWMCNGMRQFVAVCMSLLCFGLMLKKRYIFAIILILFASFFHGSALLVIPFLFIAQGKAWNKKTVLFIFSVVIAVAFIDQFTNILDNFLSDTQYTNVVSDWENANDDGTNILRVLVYSVPALISLFYRKKIRNIDDPVINFCTNMSIASAGIYIISMFTSGIYIGRLPIYFSLYGYILLPWEIKNIFSENLSKLLRLALVVLYILFYFIQLHFGWGFI